VAVTSAINDLYFYLFKKEVERTKDFNWPRIFMISWSGMRGLVSLALAVALPATLSGGVAFPYRDLIIFLTIIVILFTLMVQGLSLPKFIKWLAVSKDDDQELKLIEKTYRQLTKQAISTMQEVATKKKKYSESAVKLVEKYYANRLMQFSINVEGEATAHHIRQEARKLLAEILQYERRELSQRRVAGEFSEEIYIKILRKIDRDEVGFASYQ
jgi:monovalent cation/hydrogen antiporter